MMVLETASSPFVVAHSHGGIGTAFVSTESHRRRVERRVLHSTGWRGFCGVFIRKGEGSGHLIPYVKVYAGNHWEASGGPYATKLDVSDGCVIRLLSLTPSSPNDKVRYIGNDDDRYVVLSMNGTTSVEKQIARFLEMTTFGPTMSEIDALLLSSLGWGSKSRAGYVRLQMDVDATSHREYYWGRANVRMG
eukprot:CAMPEP_0181108036 /NCGR_PEP_ID=MMETSP1071-20121207/17409_1 /TAXON_ID=35127 /ORGANISM="Thalassiosira sp., Strain NH16" /LENGTH=190 /DNA_ID=CAMNT_0023191599 /DNA_START=131 /DNA_END=701 /DNA_ORIENTATION=+